MIKLGNLLKEEQPHQKEMVDGIVEMLVQVKDIDNRKQMALDRLRDFKKEGIEVNADEFMEKVRLVLLLVVVGIDITLKVRR